MAKAFLSYSHDTDEHVAWVERLAKSLELLGLSVIFDKWHLKFGSDINQFMESSIAEADVVLVVCTPGYISKSNLRRGGVGYESVIISSELLGNQQSIKFIPILRKCHDSVPKLPTFLGNRLYVDMTEGDGYGKEYARLMEQLSKLQSHALEILSTSKQAVDHLQGAWEGPYRVANQGCIPANILELMGIANEGLVNLELEDFKELFGEDGFWYASVTTGELSPNYEILAEHAGLQVEAAGINSNSLGAIGIAISAPESLSLEDLQMVMAKFEKYSNSDASILVTTMFQESGARISLAFQ